MPPTEQKLSQRDRQSSLPARSTSQAQFSDLACFFALACAPMEGMGGLSPNPVTQSDEPPALSPSPLTGPNSNPQNGQKCGIQSLKVKIQRLCCLRTVI